MPYLHYTGFELKIGNKTVTKELQSGEIKLFIHIFVIMLKKTLSALYTITMIIVLERLKKGLRRTQSPAQSYGRWCWKKTYPSEGMSLRSSI